MILPSLAYFLISMTILVIVLVRWRRPRLNLPPSPLCLPIIGNIHQLGSPLHLSLHHLALKHGPLVFLRLGGARVLVVSSAKMAEEVLKTQDSIFCTRPATAFASRISYGGNGVAFGLYGEGWRQLRKINVVELFTANSIESFRRMREEEMAVLLKNIAEDAVSGKLLNISERTYCYFSNIAGRQALGIRCCEKGECSKSRFQDEFRAFMKMMAESAPSDMFPVFGGWLNRVTGFHQRTENLFHFFNTLIEEHIEAKLRRNTDGDADILSILLRMQRDDSLGFRITPEQIKIAVLETFVGGTDTSSSAVESGILELLRHPRVMNKAREEVRRVLGKKKAMVEESDLADLPYLQQVVKEVLRLRPPAPLSLPHESMRDTTINGYDVPAKTTVFTNIWAIMRDPAVWEDPEVFWPERFQDSRLQFKGHDFEFIPFSAGRRICPALNVARTMVELALANLLFCFDWELPDGMRPEDIDTTTSCGAAMHLNSPLLLKATRV